LENFIEFKYTSPPGKQTKHMTKDRILPTESDLFLQPASWDDVQSIARLIYEVCEADGDTTVATTPENLEADWKDAGFNPVQDACVVVTGSGRVIGYGEVMDSQAHYHLSGDLYVHPEFKTAGVHTALLRALEERGRRHIPLAPTGHRVYLRAVTDHKDQLGQAAFTAQGYAPIRHYWRMGIELDAEPPAPVLPAGFEFKPFLREEHANAIWQARNESFQDHWGSHPITFEKFSHFFFDAPEYNPTLWAVIWDEEEVAGFSINHYRAETGWIRTLGVRQAWRKQSLGLALLQYSFAEFYRRGTKSIGLGVDAANPTGATRLYLKAGMQPVSEFIMFEKELRPGIAEPESSQP
jgi:mycothiol synthase